MAGTPRTTQLVKARGSGAFIGSAGDGRNLLCARADYAEAASCLSHSTITRQDYELAGDVAYTLAELAEEIHPSDRENNPIQEPP